MDRNEAKSIIEAILFVSDKPVAAATLKEILKNLEPADIAKCVEELNSEYGSSGRSFSIREIAGGYQMLTDPLYSKWISELYKKGPEKLRGPALETLSIIAYKQPITRGQIEAIRGVNVDSVLQTLEERGLIRTRGRVDGPGRPILYGTTTEFLQHFGLKSLEDLPKLKEFQEADLDFVQEQEKARVIDTETGKLHTLSPGESTNGEGNKPQDLSNAMEQVQSQQASQSSGEEKKDESKETS
ncbi:MAG: SMC-Scp complex subunit ScpB [Candidatus Omnitrophica bacterium]|nr:SMC-Scp complex subunit ScpB [Candidatus Omnitrophota bacterium]